GAVKQRTAGQARNGQGGGRTGDGRTGDGRTGELRNGREPWGGFPAVLLGGWSAGHDADAQGGRDRGPRLGVARAAVGRDGVAADPDAAAGVLRVEGSARVAALDHVAAGEDDDRRLAAGLGAHLPADAGRGVPAVLTGGPAAVAVVVVADEGGA